MAKPFVNIRAASYKGGQGAFLAVLGGIDFKMVKQLEIISGRNVAKLKAVWPIGPNRNRPHSITLFRVARKRRNVEVSNAAFYANQIVSPRTIGSADVALAQMVQDISDDFATYLRVVKHIAN